MEQHIAAITKKFKDPIGSFFYTYIRYNIESVIELLSLEP